MVPQGVHGSGGEREGGHEVAGGQVQHQHVTAASHLSPLTTYNEQISHLVARTFFSRQKFENLMRTH